MSDLITLADVEAQIRQHQRSIEELCVTGLLLDEGVVMSGAEALSWLLANGFRSSVAAIALIDGLAPQRAAAREALLPPCPSTDSGRCFAARHGAGDEFCRTNGCVYPGFLEHRNDKANGPTET